MIDEALENLVKGVAVIQSLKIIRKIVSLNGEVNPELLNHVISKNVVTQAFVSLKKLKADLKANSQKTGTQLNDSSVNQLLPDKNYNFETHVLKRLAFIDFVILSGFQTRESILSSINIIWDELVENSIIDNEANYFKKWFVQLGKDSKKIINQEVLSTFYYDKIKVLYAPKTGTSKKDLLYIFMEIFVKLNLLVEKTVATTVRIEEETGYTSEEKLLVKVYPEELEGIDALWNILLEGKNETVLKDLMPFVTNLYTRPELDKIDPSDGYNDYMKSFINKCIRLVKERVSQEDFLTNEESQKTANLLLTMICDMIDKTESRTPIPNASLSSFYRTRTTTITVENKITTSYNTPKSIDIKVDASTTIMQIKQMISREIKRTTWKNIKLLKGYKQIEILDKYNGRSLRELGISVGEKLTSEFRSAPIQAAEPLVFTINDVVSVNPKAMKAFKLIYNQFAVDGKMGPNELVKYTEAALDEKNLTPEFTQIRELLSKYDQGHKGFLSEFDFVSFYTEACLNKSTAVITNLRNLGYNDQLVKESEVQDTQSVEDLARDYILSKTDFVHILYDLTESCPKLSESAWAILSRLPPMSDLIENIINLAGVKGADVPDWNSIVETRSTIKALYNFHILDILLDDTKLEGTESPLEKYVKEDIDGFKKKWKRDFIQLGGYQFLFKVLKNFVARGVSNANDVMLFGFIMRAVRSYMLAIATNKQPEIYRNIAYISNPDIPFVILTRSEQSHSTAEPETPAIPQPLAEDVPRTPPEKINPNLQIGPLTQEDAIKKNTDTNTETKEQSDAKKDQAKYGQLLVEKKEFVEFRSLLKEMQAESHEDVDSIETLRFLIRLCESILTKKQNQNFDELAIIELSLGIIFCLILSDLELLKKLVISKEIKLLSEDTTIRTEENSDFISFFIAGLLTKRGFLFIKFFDNSFKILLREAGSAEVQLVLVKIVFENTLKDGLSLRDSSRHVELAALLLESICTEHKDDKIMVTKDILNSIINLEDLFLQIYEKIFHVKCTVKEEAFAENQLIVGYFKILEMILSIEARVKAKLSTERSDIVKRLFSECLFNSPDQEGEPRELVCRNFYTRSAAFEMVNEVCKNSPANTRNLFEFGLLELSRNLPKITSWSYTSLFGRRSALGFVGIYNPSCICYMNAMLQQFYMTPTFRYNLLMANDHEEENIVSTTDNKKVDDNLFHQLQRMFGFLDKSERKDYNPSGFCFSYKDYSGQPVNVSIQQDTKEFLDVFFDKIENTLRPTPFRNILRDVYGGKQISVIECSMCGNLRTREEVFYNLSLEVKNLKNINEGIEKLITEDIISDFKCEACNNKCDVLKRTLLKECPNVLIIHLQRIIFDLDVLMNVKVNTWYEFPQKMNLKDYTYDRFMQNFNNQKEGEEAFGKGENETTDATYSENTKGNVETEESDIKEDRNDDEEKKQGEAEKEGEDVKEETEENFEYNLAGVIVHLGSADVGHYYSYINVNRGDPGRPKIVEDKWIEFNDSTIRNFKFNDLEEECFGSKEEPRMARFDDDYDNGFLLGREGKFKIDKCAYILVYEKTQKKPITFSFDHSNISEKELIINNIKEDKLDSVVWKKGEDGCDELQVGFYDFKQYIPPKLASEIKEDNYKFLIEQHVYSKEFLNFICILTELKEIPDFLPDRLPNRIYIGEVPEDLRKVHSDFLEANFQFLLEVFSKTEDNLVKKR